MDFKPEKQYRSVSENHQFLRKIINTITQEERWYKKINGVENTYNIDERGLENPEMRLRGIIGRISRKGRLVIYGQQESNAISIVENKEEIENEQQFPNEIEDAIRNGKAVAVVDASVDERYMVVQWVITTMDKQVKSTGYISSSKWGEGQIPVAERIGVLNLIKEIHTKTAHMNIRSIIVYSDMKTIITEVRKEIVKESQCVREAGATITEIRKEIEQAKISISLEYSSTKTRHSKNFEDNPGLYLMRECDKQSKMMRREMEDKEHEYIMHVADTTPIYENVISNKLISVLIWEIDAKENEKLYAESKCSEYSS